MASIADIEKLIASQTKHVVSRKDDLAGAKKIGRGAIFDVQAIEPPIDNAHSQGVGSRLHFLFLGASYVPEDFGVHDTETGEVAMIVQERIPGQKGKYAVMYTKSSSDPEKTVKRTVDFVPGVTMDSLTSFAQMREGIKAGDIIRVTGIIVTGKVDDESPTGVRTFMSGNHEVSRVAYTGGKSLMDLDPMAPVFTMTDPAEMAKWTKFLIYSDPHRNGEFMQHPRGRHITVNQVEDAQFFHEEKKQKHSEHDMLVSQALGDPMNRLTVMLSGEGWAEAHEHAYMMTANARHWKTIGEMLCAKGAWIGVAQVDRKGTMAMPVNEGGSEGTCGGKFKLRGLFFKRTQTIQYVGVPCTAAGYGKKWLGDNEEHFKSKAYYADCAANPDDAKTVDETDFVNLGEIKNTEGFLKLNEDGSVWVHPKFKLLALPVKDDMDKYVDDNGAEKLTPEEGDRMLMEGAKIRKAELPSLKGSTVFLYAVRVGKKKSKKKKKDKKAKKEKKAANGGAKRAADDAEAPPAKRKAAEATDGTPEPAPAPPAPETPAGDSSDSDAPAPAGMAVDGDSSSS